MNLDDIKDRLKSEWQSSMEKLNESPAVIQIKDRYENLNPMMQKLVSWGGAGLLVLLVASVPWSWYSTSQESVDQFLTRRNLIRDLMKASRDAQNTSPMPPAPPASVLKNQTNDIFKSAQLLPEQIISSESSNEPMAGIRADLIQGVYKIQLAKLNLRQIVDVGHQLQNISPSIKLKDMSVQASSMTGYFDVNYKLLVLNVPDFTPPPPSMDDKKVKAKK